MSCLITHIMQHSRWIQHVMQIILFLVKSLIRPSWPSKQLLMYIKMICNTSKSTREICNRFCIHNSQKDNKERCTTSKGQKEYFVIFCLKQCPRRQAMNDRSILELFGRQSFHLTARSLTGNTENRTIRFRSCQLLVGEVDGVAGLNCF